MTDAKAPLAREGTMQATAKEGVSYLESTGHHTLIAKQDLKEGGAKPKEGGEDAGACADKPSLPRDSTMAVTAKEGEEFLETAGGNIDSDAQTRGQQKKIEDIQSEAADSPSPKKARLSKEGTMAVTAKEGKELLNNDNLAGTRQETAKTRKGRPATKREGTMAKTMAEAKTLIGDDDLTGGRRTRSSSRGTPPKPPVKRAGTMQQTAKDGKEFVQRSKKGKKAAVVEKEEVEEAADAEEGEESEAKE